MGLKETNLSLFLMLLKWCFYPDPLIHFDSMSLNMKFFFIEGVPNISQISELKPNLTANTPSGSG